jgi:hypothetical protein
MPGSPLPQLQPRAAFLSRAPDGVSLTIELAPFIHEGDLIDTSIRLSGFSLPSLVLADLVGRTFTFPVNPVEGYIDGSIYLFSAHHPVDVTYMTFHRSRSGGATVVLKGVIDFEFEGEEGWGRMPFTFGTGVWTSAV